MHLPSDFLSYFALGVLLMLFIYFTVIFNNLVSLKNNVKKAWANIEVLLKQRHDELPKLIQTCQQYMQYERSTLESITEARSRAIVAREQGNINELNKAEAALKGGLTHLFALAENYPDLKSNQTFIHLQQRISTLENSIADRRELYNESITLNNIRIEQFPDLIVAKLFSFKHHDPLEFASAELSDIDINASFSK